MSKRLTDWVAEQENKGMSEYDIAADLENGNLEKPTWLDYSATTLIGFALWDRDESDGHIHLYALNNTLPEDELSQTQALVVKFNGDYAVSINGINGVCLGGNTAWSTNDGWNSGCDETYKYIVDNGDVVMDINDIAADDIRDEIERENALLVDDIR